MVLTRRAVILAGGEGERVKRLLHGIPKPMAPADGRPFLEWVIRFLASQDVRTIVVSSGYLALVVSEFVKGLKVEGVTLECVVEDVAQGTAGGFLNAIKGQPQSEAPWLVCNGDSLALTSVNPLYVALENPVVQAAILGLHQDDASRYGSLELGPDGVLSRFLEKRPGAGLINSGIILIGARLIPRFPDHRPLSFESDVFPFLLEQGVTIQVCPAEAPFLDIGTEETLKKAHGFVAAHRLSFQKEGSEGESAV